MTNLSRIVQPITAGTLVLLGTGTVESSSYGILQPLLDGGVLSVLVGILMWQASRREERISSEAANRENRFIQEVTEARERLSSLQGDVIRTHTVIIEQSIDVLNRMARNQERLEEKLERYSCPNVKLIKSPTGKDGTDVI